MARRLADLVHDLAPQLSSRDRTDADRYPSENIADLIGAGVIRAPFPESAGGCGATLLDSVEAMELITLVQERIIESATNLYKGVEKNASQPYG